MTSWKIVLNIAIASILFILTLVVLLGLLMTTCVPDNETIVPNIGTPIKVYNPTHFAGEPIQEEVVIVDDDSFEKNEGVN